MMHSAVRPLSQAKAMAKGSGRDHERSRAIQTQLKLIEAAA